MTLSVTDEDLVTVLDRISDYVEWLHSPLPEDTSVDEAIAAASRVPYVNAFTWTSVADLLAPLISADRFREVLADRVALRSDIQTYVPPPAHWGVR